MTQRGLPAWLRPLAEMASSIEAERLAPRFPHPPADARPAAVLMLFADGPSGPELVLTERASTLRNHAGQISFPGGGADEADGAGPDGAVVTALREAEEEIGVDPASVEVFGVLPTLWLPPSNFAVTPVLGYWHAREVLQPVSRAEVGRVFHQPIDDLLDPANRFTIVNPAGWRGPAFDIGIETPLWGFTGGIISRVFEAVGWEKPWDDTVERPVPEPA